MMCVPVARVYANINARKSLRRYFWFQSKMNTPHPLCAAAVAVVVVVATCVIYVEKAQVLNMLLIAELSLLGLPT